MTGKRRAPIGARGGTPWTPGAGWVGLVVAAALSIDPGSVRGQDPRSAGPVGDDGAYLLSFPIRDDVGLCPGGGVHVGGTGEHTVWIRGRDGEECASGRAVARIRMRDGRLRALELERPRPTTLGEARAVPGSEAARAFLFLARGAVDGDVGEEAVLGAAVARDAVVWPGLLDLARSRELHRQTRKSAVFWLGQRAADASVRELGSLARADDEDREVRKAAVFALSRLEGGRARDALMEVARSRTDPEVRRAAFIWLAREPDAEVLAFFEEILSRGR